MHINLTYTLELAFVAALVIGYVAVTLIRLRKRWNETTRFTRWIVLSSAAFDFVVILALGGMVFERGLWLTFHTQIFIIGYACYKTTWLIYHIAEIVEDRTIDDHSKLG